VSFSQDPPPSGVLQPARSVEPASSIAITRYRANNLMDRRYHLVAWTCPLRARKMSARFCTHRQSHFLSPCARGGASLGASRIPPRPHPMQRKGGSRTCCRLSSVVEQRFCEPLAMLFALPLWSRIVAKSAVFQALSHRLAPCRPE
jgi:hypothetical protein